MAGIQRENQEATPRKSPGLFGSSGMSGHDKRLSQDITKDMGRLSEDFLNLSRRLKLVEDRAEAIRRHLDMLDTSLVNKHKATIKELRRVEEDLRITREQARENTSMTDRILKRIEVFATKDKVAVLDKYISMWQPLKYTTAKDVERIVQEKLAALAEIEKDNDERE